MKVVEIYGKNRNKKLFYHVYILFLFTFLGVVYIRYTPYKIYCIYLYK